MVTTEFMQGFRERFVDIVEGTYGSAGTLSSGAIPGYDVVVSPNFTQGWQEILTAGTDDRNVNSRVAGPLNLAYNLSYVPSNWRRLKYVFDIDSETGTSPTTHTLSVGNTLKSYTAEWALRHDSTPIIIKTTGNVVNTTTITFQKATGEGNDGFIKISQDCIAQNYTTPSIDGTSFSVTGDPFQYRHMTWTLNSSAVVEVNNGSITFDQGINAADSRYASSSLGRTIGSPIPTLFRISGRFNVNLKDTTYMDLWEAATVVGGTNTLVFEQTASNKITFTFTGMYVEPVPVGNTNLTGVNSADFVFTATGVTVVALDAIANW